MMMNDKEFRDNCKVLANDIVENNMGLRRQLKVPKRWCDRDNFGDLQAAALLYIAANMPSANDENKKPCKLCGSYKTIDCTGVDLDGGVDHYFYINTKQKQLVEVNGKVKTHISIKYCPMCGREL